MREWSLARFLVLWKKLQFQDWKSDMGRMIEKCQRESKKVGRITVAPSSDLNATDESHSFSQKSVVLQSNKSCNHGLLFLRRMRRSAQKEPSGRTRLSLSSMWLGELCRLPSVVLWRYVGWRPTKPNRMVYLPHDYKILVARVAFRRGSTNCFN